MNLIDGARSFSALFPCHLGKPSVKMIETRDHQSGLQSPVGKQFAGCPDSQWTLREEDTNFCCVKPLGCGVICYCSIIQPILVHTGVQIFWIILIEQLEMFENGFTGPMNLSNYIQKSRAYIFLKRYKCQDFPFQPLVGIKRRPQNQNPPLFPTLTAFLWDYQD